MARSGFHFFVETAGVGVGRFPFFRHTYVGDIGVGDRGKKLSEKKEQSTPAFGRLLAVEKRTQKKTSVSVGKKRPKKQLLVFGSRHGWQQTGDTVNR